MGGSSERFSIRRWKPTAEQLAVLEDLYSKALRSPNTEQIHQIADFLARFGEIQAKNVFYWFQNRKGSERLKKRRKLEEFMDSISSKPADNKAAECAFGLSCKKMKALNTTALKEQEKITFKKWSMEEDGAGNIKKGDNNGNVQLEWPANINLRNTGCAWSMAPTETTMKAVNRSEYCIQFHEREDRNEVLRTLQLFPLKPTILRCENDETLN